MICANCQNNSTEFLTTGQLIICYDCVMALQTLRDARRVGCPEDAVKYRYHWRAVLKDGSVRTQFEAGKEVSFISVPADSIRTIELVPQIKGYPPITLYAGCATPFKFWQSTVSGSTGQLHEHREVLGYETPSLTPYERLYVMFGVDGSVVISPTPDV